MHSRSDMPQQNPILVPLIKLSRVHVERPNNPEIASVHMHASIEPSLCYSRVKFMLRWSRIPLQDADILCR